MARGRGRDQEPKWVHLVTSAAADGHSHCATLYAPSGIGRTNQGPDGHVHQVEGLAVLAVAGHGHELAQRCPRSHRDDGDPSCRAPAARERERRP